MGETIRLIENQIKIKMKETTFSKIHTFESISLVFKCLCDIWLLLLLSKGDKK
jgi:hypothetical protein